MRKVLVVLNFCKAGTLLLMGKNFCMYNCIYLCSACMANDIQHIWFAAAVKFFLVNENRRTVERDMLWPSKRTRQLPGVYLRVVACLLAVLEKR